MKTKEQINKELIEYYKIRVKELEGELASAKEKLRKMWSTYKVSPQNEWYLIYLMSANSALEKEVENRQQVIEQYQRHYSKFGRFYNEYEKAVETRKDNA